MIEAHESTAAPADAMQMIDDLLAGVRVTIEGVTYVPFDRNHLPFNQKIYLQRIALEAGLEDPARLMIRGASIEQNAKQLLLALYRSGRTFDYLAGALVPEGEKWNEQKATVLALRLVDLEDAATQDMLQQLIAVLVAAFFGVGRSSFVTSPSASPKTTAVEAAHDVSAAPSSSAKTAASSADSLPMTPPG
jgi:hypothetical protein